MSGVAVKTYVPSEAEKKHSFAEIQKKFWDLPVIENAVTSQIQDEQDGKAWLKLREMVHHYKPNAELGENDVKFITGKQFKEELEKLSALPEQYTTPPNLEMMSAEEAAELQSQINQLAQKRAEQLRSLKEQANSLPDDQILNSFGPESNYALFFETAALQIARASVLAGSSDPQAWLKSLYTKEKPSNFGEGIAMDLLVGLHTGAARDASSSFAQQILEDGKVAEGLVQFENMIAEEWKKPDFASRLSFYMKVEVNQTPNFHEEEVQNDDMYRMFFVGIPILLLVIVHGYWQEIQHTLHLRHDQHDRVHALLHGGEEAHGKHH